jgi:uncharacterized protein involved in exopolysaccharide biosynthesis
MRQEDRDDAGVDLLAAVRRHPFAFVLPIIVLAVGLGAIGVLRDPTYTAEARIAIGKLDLQTQGLPGFTQAGAQIAAAYSRAIDAPSVVVPAARSASVTPATAADSLTASPIPDAPLIRVEAETEDERQAVKLANSGATSLVAYARRNLQASGTQDDLLEEYTELVREVKRLEIRRDSLVRQYLRKPGRVRRVAVQDAEGKLQRTTLERDAARQRFGAQATGASAGNLLTVLAPATGASSDETKTRNRLALTGALAGIVVGLALAAWRESRRRRRTEPAA